MMKFSSSILLSTLATFLFASNGALAAPQVDCLDEKRYNLESMCRHECSKLDVEVAAFSVSYADDDNSCRCFPKMMEGGKYIGNHGDKGMSQFTCYSMTEPKTRVLDYGDCSFVGTSTSRGIIAPPPTDLLLKICPPRQQHQEEEDTTLCLDEMRYNLESMCRIECAKHDAIAFSVSYQEDNDSCRCFPKLKSGEILEHEKTYNGTGNRKSRMTCYSMIGKTKLLDYGDCTLDGIDAVYDVQEYTLQRCPAISGADHLRGSRRRVLV